MPITPFILVTILLACIQPKPQPVKTNKNTAKTLSKPKAKTSLASQTTAKPVKTQTLAAPKSNPFNGSYVGTQLGHQVTIDLSAQDKEVNGVLSMNGQQAKIEGTVQQGICKGIIIEDESGKTYAFVAEQKAENLHFSLTFPEQQNKVVTLILQRTQLQANSKPTGNNQYKNPSLIGTWRYTEVISSGSGEFYSSFSTDYFIKFNGNGTALVWTGKSAGGTKNVSIDGPRQGQAQQVAWYTEGKNLFFVDPDTKTKSAIGYYAEANRMMLSNGKNKKVYQRIN